MCFAPVSQRDVAAVDSLLRGRPRAFRRRGEEVHARGVARLPAVCVARLCARHHCLGQNLEFAVQKKKKKEKKTWHRLTEPCECAIMWWLPRLSIQVYGSWQRDTPCQQSWIEKLVLGKLPSCLYRAHFIPVFPRLLRVFTVSTRRFQRAPHRNPEPRNSRHDDQEGRTPPLVVRHPDASGGRINWDA